MADKEGLRLETELEIKNVEVEIKEIEVEMYRNSYEISSLKKQLMKKTFLKMNLKTIWNLFYQMLIMEIFLYIIL